MKGKSITVAKQQNTEVESKRAATTAGTRSGGAKAGTTAAATPKARAATPAPVASERPAAPAVKPEPKKRGRKPKAEMQQDDSTIEDVTEEFYDNDAPATPAAAPKTEKQKAKDRKAKEKALLKEFASSNQAGSEEELEIRRQKLKALIKLGKSRGYLTYAEINDHLPDDMVDSETIDTLVATLNDI
ncbi:MAG TPA: RNA polymerase sigma factor RpoD, partial [Cupriavidus sp.]|nr:RNA polymerase sigma factor RpoD [Cupriavidus sp.]